MQRAVIHGVPSTVCRLAFSQKLKSHSTWRRLTCRLAGDQQLRWYSSGGQPVAGNSYVDEMYKAWQRDPKSVHMVRTYINLTELLAEYLKNLGNS